MAKIDWSYEGPAGYTSSPPDEPRSMSSNALSRQLDTFRPSSLGSQKTRTFSARIQPRTVSARLIPLNEVDEALIEGWRKLVREALEPNPFTEADFVLHAARWLASGERAAAVVVECDGELRFVLPAIRIRHFRGIPLPALATWSDAYSFLGTPLL
jgi:hypothetical protein